ncbi:hypothetical protein JVT61DRAFT_2576 [Boletus reticuloceps]|uniref:DUF6593 domain-containing protein n=1 Tax=Boletus reticuloceps TaxID=495285 RepID=A0A8I2YP26_9AGAM|nr:hypothetical protein JVT61DRAFT_2576 [Boletus reticuloceps]
MRLIFSTTDHLNTDISDERGYIYYTISTPFAFKKVTTITKYRWSGPSSVPETMGVIEWHRLKETMFRFDGKEVPANVMLDKRPWNTGRYFVGPDQQTYKWKLESSYCWMKPAESHVELVRFHKKNLGILKEAHPAYLNVSPNVVSMLDHVILTFVYVEWLRQQQARSRHHRHHMGAGGVNFAPTGGITM